VGDKTDVWQGTLAIMCCVAKRLGPGTDMNGETDRTDETGMFCFLQVNYGPLIPLLRLEQEGLSGPDGAYRKIIAKRIIESQSRPAAGKKALPNGNRPRRSGSLLLQPAKGKETMEIASLLFRLLGLSAHSGVRTRTCRRVESHIALHRRGYPRRT